MKYTLPVLAAAITLFSCNKKMTNTNSNANAMSVSKAEIGFTRIFDGTTTAGWHGYGQKPVGAAWKVADGNLYLDTAKKDGWQTNAGGDILTDKEYENFHLKYDWKISANGNSGVIFLVHEDTAKYKYVWFTGPEMQVLDNAGHPDAKIIKHRAGDLYDLISSTSEPVKPANEWNTAEIIINKGKLDLILNGVNIVSTTMWDDNWRKLIAGSKFKSMQDFGSYRKGRIALQDHGNMVWFRNIMIKEL